MAMFISDRPMQKVLLKNTTRMSLHERFTYLRSTSGEGSNQVQRQRELQQQTARNRRLALQMERRPAVMAALKLKKKSVRQRLGLSGVAGIGGNSAAKGGFNSIKDRLTLGGRKGRKLGMGRGGVRLGQLQQSPQQRRGRQRGGGGGGPNARGRLSRSQSMQSLNNAGKFTNRARSRSRSRSRVRANSISQNNLNVNSNNQMRFRSRSRNRSVLGRGSSRGGSPRFIQRGRLGARGGRGSVFRGRRIGNNWGSGRGRRGNDRGRGGRGRGAGSRGRGRGTGRGGRGRRGGGNNPVPTKEELDNQLDQYMANSRYKLDEDIDSYMKEAYSMGGPSASKAAAAQEESWD